MSCRCCEGHCHHEHDVNKNTCFLLIFKIIVGVLALVLGHVFEDTGNVSLYITICAYFIVAYDIFLEAFKEIKEGEIFSEYLLMIISTIGAFFVGEYHESIMVMLLFIVGELLQGIAVEKSRESIVKLVGLNKNKVHLKKDKSVIEVDPTQLKKGDIIVLKKGQMLSVDGRIVKGTGYVDTSNLTGESIPKAVNIGSEVYSGVINTSNALEIEVVNEYSDSKINKVLSLVEEASDRKSKSDKIIRKIARWYTPIVILLAIINVLVSLIFKVGDVKDSIYTSLTFLLISCPCAIIISVPITYFAAIGGASKKGVLIKGANYLDTLYRVKNIAFDKTGTISEGKFSVSKLEIYQGCSKEDFVKFLLLTQSNSVHPIADSIKQYFDNCKVDISVIKETREEPGLGISIILDNDEIICSGNKNMMDKYGVACEDIREGTIVYVSKDKVCLGYVLLEDKIKESSYIAMKMLKNYRKIMLSGDNEEACKKVSENLEIDEYYSQLLPEDKMAILEKLIKDGQTMFVGDGINDTLSISLADVSVSMGMRGSDATIEYSDIVIGNDNLTNIDTAFKFAKKTRIIILENLISIMTLKIIFMILSLFGFVNMWLAIFSDVGLCIISILNSMRASNVK